MPNPTQRELIHKIEQLYHDIVAATRANRLTHALDKIEVAEALLDPEILPESYCRRIHLKIDRVKEDMRERYLRDIRSGRRQKEERMLEHLMISSLPEMSQIPLPALPAAAPPRVSGRGGMTSSVPENRPDKPARVPEPAEEENDTAAGQEIPRRVEAGESLPKEQPGIAEPVSPPDDEPPVKVPRAARFMLDEKLDMLYEDGLAFYRQGLYDQARRILNSVHRASPGYKLTAEYLRLIDRLTADDRGEEKERAEESFGDPENKRAAVIEYYLDAYD